MNRRIVLTGGGTGGHIIPNLALVPYLTPYFEIYYVGTHNDAELVSAISPHISFDAIPSVKLTRPIFNLSNALIPIKLQVCKNSAVKLLKKIEPDIVFSKGGFASLPVMLACQKLSIPYIIHESDYTMGLSNKLCHKKAKVVLGSFYNSVKNIKNGIHTGSPIRKLNGDKNRIDLSNLNQSLPTILVVGGSSGAKAINSTIRDSIDVLLKTYNVVHITGKSDVNTTRRRGYIALQFTHNIGDYIDAADMVVTRAGANALFELISLHKPTLAIPLPASASRGDQIQNAQYFFDKKCILVLRQEDLNQDNLLNKLSELHINRDILINHCKQQKIDGTQRIADILLARTPLDPNKLYLPI